LLASFSAKNVSRIVKLISVRVKGRTKRQHRTELKRIVYFIFVALNTPLD